MMNIIEADRYILGVSGGKDSAALAVYMSQEFPHLDIEYFFTDTGEELDWEEKTHLKITSKNITIFFPMLSKDGAHRS